MSECGRKRLMTSLSGLSLSFNSFHSSKPARAEDKSWISPLKIPLTKSPLRLKVSSRNFTVGRLSLCHCSYCSRQLNSSLQRPCEGASGQLNLILSPSVDCSTQLYLQRIHIIHRVLSDIWICSPAVLHNTAVFYWYQTWHVCTHS